MRIASAVVSLVGLVYAWMIYFVPPTDEFAVVNHPWQPDVRHMHVWSAPLLVFALGILWRTHAWRRLSADHPESQRSGRILLSSCVPMIASGYLIQTSLNPFWERVWIATHLLASGLWVLGYLIHEGGLLKQRFSP